MSPEDRYSERERATETERAGAAGGPSGPLTAALTVGWVLLVALNFGARGDDVDRAIAFDHPARVAARVHERPLELFAALPRLADQEDLLESGPLGLDPKFALEVAKSLVSSARTLESGAERVLERDATEVPAAESIENAERKALRLRRAAAELAARALAIERSFGSESADSSADLRQADDLLALDPKLQAEVLAAWEGDGEWPAALDGLPQLLFAESRGELPSVREWRATEAIERVAGPTAFAVVALPIALVALGLLLGSRRALLVPEPALSARIPLGPAWTSFVAGRIAFVLVSSLMLLVGAGGVTGYIVVVTSAPVAFFAFVAAGWRPGAALGPAAERLGLAGSLRVAPRALACGLAAVPAMLLGQFAFMLLLGAEVTPWSNPYLDFVLGEGLGGWKRMAMEAGVAAPLFEELAFRGLLFAGLRSRFGFLPSALASSAIFAIAHPYDLAGLSVILWVGFVLAWLYERTGSLVACMIAHCVFNLAGLSFMLLLL